MCLFVRVCVCEAVSRPLVGCLHVASGFLFPLLYFHESWLFILGSLSWLSAPTFSFLAQRWVGYAFQHCTASGLQLLSFSKPFFFFFARVKIKNLLNIFHALFIYIFFNIVFFP